MSLSEYKTQNNQKEETLNLKSQAPIAPQIQSQAQEILQFQNIDQLQPELEYNSQTGAKMLVIMNTGEHCLLTVMLMPGESFYVHEILDRFGIPVTDQKNIRCIPNPRANIDNIDFIVIVGFSSTELTSDILSGLQLNEVQATTSQIGDNAVSSIDLVEKEEVSKYVPMFLSLCRTCGYCIYDNDKCERCDLNFIEMPKEEEKMQVDTTEKVTSTSGLSTQGKPQQDEQVILSTDNNGDNDKSHPPSLKQININSSSNQITMPQVINETAAVATASLNVAAAEETPKIIPQAIIPPEIQAQKQEDIIPSQNQNQLQIPPKRNSQKMLVTLNSGENILIKFTNPIKSCTVYEILELAGIPFTNETLQCVPTPGIDIDYVVNVGVPVLESTGNLVTASENSLQLNKVQQTISQIHQQSAVEQPHCSQPSFADENVTSMDSINKVLPPKYITGALAQCNTCGYFGEDHSKCERELDSFPFSMSTAANVNAIDEDTKRHMTLIQNDTASPRQGKLSTQMRAAEVECKLTRSGDETAASTTCGHESSPTKINASDEEKGRNLKKIQTATFSNCPIAIRQRPARVIEARKRDKPYGLPRARRN